MRPPDIICIGEAFVDFIGERGVQDLGESRLFNRVSGGAVANVAIGLARLGARVAFIGAIGADPFGDFLMRTLASEGVEIDGVRAFEEATALIFVSRGPGGSRDFLPVNLPGAHTALRWADINQNRLANARAIHCGGVLLARDPGASACIEAMRHAGRHAIVSFDPNPRPKFFQDAGVMRTILLQACALADLVKASHDDLKDMGLHGEPSPKRLLAGATKAVVVTRGAEGCAWATADGNSGETAAPPIECVDSTGAGDAFAAALLWRIIYAHEGRLTAEAMSDATRWAVAAGALACRREGAITSLPRAAELEALATAAR